MPGVRFHKNIHPTAFALTLSINAIVLHLNAITDYSLTDMFYHREKTLLLRNMYDCSRKFHNDGKC